MQVGDSYTLSYLTLCLNIFSNSFSLRAYFGVRLRGLRVHLTLKKSFSKDSSIGWDYA